MILEVRDLTKVFPAGKGRTLKAVDSISFTVNKGECLAVIGESGCGKSTLARLVTGVEKATSGSILFMGEDVANAGRRELKAMRRNMQMIFQSPVSSVSPRMTIGTFLLEPYINYGICCRQEAQERISELLSKVRLNDDCLRKYPHQLSGGELQRVCIARAFSLDPRLLVCDEITSALDVSVQDDVLRLFHSLQTGSGIACLFICHDLALVSSFSDRVMVMYLGQTVEIIDSKRLGRDAVHPYTIGLLRSMLFVSSDRNKPLTAMKGELQSPVDIPENCHFCTRCPYAEKRCFLERPQLREVETGHLAACFRV
ncbi:MAG: ABC transporter ATP-binding protein [Firmicutes bacterium]|nr:ABC transporter ATP-binding protein [Bacillota bacterium]